MQVARRTVDDTLKRYYDTGSVKERSGRGRKRKIPEEDETKIVKMAKKGVPATDLARAYTEETGTNVCLNTIRKTLHKHNLRWLVNQEKEEISEDNKVRREEYANDQMHRNWRRVLFSDEKSFWLGSSPTHSWQEPGKRKTRSVTRHPPKLHVWAAAGYYVKSKLYFFTHNLDSDLYLTILDERISENHLIYAPDCPRSLRGKWHFLQDNDPKHKAASTMSYLRQTVGRRIISHPSQSPDLNIMEDLWSYLDRKIKIAHVKTIEHLKHQLTKEWANLPWSEIRKSAASMPARIAECVQLHGERTHY
jgi:transposase